MIPKNQKIIDALRAARLSKGMSQSELSRLARVPQAQISRIEAGNVDIRLSSLTSLAHALDIEITLVPREATPAVQSITRQISQLRPIQDPAIGKELQRLQKAIHAIQINASVNMPIVDELQKTYAAFKPLRIDLKFLNPLRDIRIQLEHMQTLEQSFKDITKGGKMTEAIQSMKHMHDRITRTLTSLDEPDKPRPAYTLDEDDD